jgi:hypothetical protein
MLCGSEVSLGTNGFDTDYENIQMQALDFGF